MSVTPHLDAVVFTLHEALNLLDSEDVEGEGDDAAMLVRLLVAIRDLRAALALDARQAELALAKIADRVVVEGVGEARVRHSVKRTQWQTDDLVRTVVARAVDEPGVAYDPDTGEALPQAHVAAAIASALRDCISFGAGKTTGLRARGIDPDEYCTVGEHEVTVQLPRREL